MKFGSSLWQMDCPTCNFWEVNSRNFLWILLQKGCGTRPFAHAADCEAVLVKPHDSEPGKTPTFSQLHLFLSCTPPSQHGPGLTGLDQLEEAHTTRICRFLCHCHQHQHQQRASFVEGGACRHQKMEVHNPFEIE